MALCGDFAAGEARPSCVRLSLRHFVHDGVRLLGVVEDVDGVIGDGVGALVLEDSLFGCDAWVGYSADPVGVGWRELVQWKW